MCNEVKGCKNAHFFKQSEFLLKLWIFDPLPHEYSNLQLHENLT